MNNNKFINWMKNSFSPKLTKICQNAYIASVQKAIMTVLPIIMIGSFVTILSLARDISFLSWIPDVSLVNQFTFGLMSVFMAFLIPIKFLEEKHEEKFKNIASLSSLGTFLVLLMPTFDAENATMNLMLDKIGTGGMLCAVFVGLLCSKVFHIASKHSLFSEDTAMPDLIVNMFDSMIPVIICIAFGVTCYLLNFDLYELLRSLFSPLSVISQTIPGVVLIAFAECFLYSFGFTWILFPLQWTIWMEGISANAAAVSAGNAASNICVMETYNGMFNIGGVGATLTLVILMCLSKSKKLKAIGRVCALPAILNINEPVVFGAPVAYNPILMIPFWLNSVVISLIAALAYYFGFVAIPSAVNQLWYLPTVVQAFLNSGIAGVVLCLVLTVV
ncbi:MAG: PTS transporter subunit EIIC, partial [Longicatena sp.]